MNLHKLKTYADAVLDRQIDEICSWVRLFLKKPVFDNPVTVNAGLTATGAATVGGALSVGGRVTLALPVYDDNATAQAGGLPVGALYRTSAGAVMAVIA